jgi:urease accessory protein
VRPTFPGTTAAALCVVTFGAGLVDGDEIEVEVEVEPEATLVLFTQASTKVFRGQAKQRLTADVHGTLVALPDPVAPFAGARYEQRVDVRLHGDDARCVLLDGVTSGRPAFGERWAFERVDLRTTVRRGERTVVHDALRLDAADAPVARRMDRFEALLTLLAVGAPSIDTAIAASDEVARDLVVASNAGSGHALARIAATSPERAIAAARSRLRGLPELGVADPFGARA